MKITIHRGQNQIGGSIIEIASDKARIILDAGSELDEEVPTAPQIEGLFCEKANYDAVFVSHYHGDHIGLCDKVLPEIPIYIGKGAASVTNTARRYLSLEEYRFTGFYESGKAITVGDLQITPYLCDHSAYDSYMFHVACGEKSIIYSGDFRSSGRKNFKALLNRLPRADALIVEGTTLSRSPSHTLSENDLEKLAVDEISKINTPVFILQAATNIDRIVTAFKAAKKTNRILLEDLYTAEVTSAAGGRIPNPLTFSDVRVFITETQCYRHELLNTKYSKGKIGKTGISKKDFVMCVRPSMQNYLEGLSKLVPFENGILFYSMWEGYKKKEDISRFLHFMQEKGVRIVNLHTSGHANEQAVFSLVNDINPQYIIPVHTENASKFEECGKQVIYEKEFLL